ncbi:LOW QUALITY PROTEIN: hypothetical protein CVT26_012044 [Gymnopilus dilepis]|uniref:F-box domain-containing protein n=1 Tax=Gymnopilus dilepis TaxID=231916 RepID=A0A409VYG3_9AGAR|nr:LOW QUALITY PROTEIN: hypothetical protein CVT26_012044 [Gymnopilus dilepis]
MSIRRNSTSQLAELMDHLKFNKGLNVPSSPVPRLLQSNSSPSDEERAKVERVLTTARQRAMKIQELLRSNPKPPEPIRLRHLQTLERMETFIRTHQSILSAFRTLPNEVLSLIFTACLPDVEYLPWQQCKWRKMASFRLSKVCKRWRYIAISTPRLWSILGDVIVDETTAGGTKGSSYLDFLEELLRRSGNHDLWVFISSPIAHYFPECHPIIEALLKHEHRWAALGLYGGSFLIGSIINRPLPSSSSLVRLRKFYLNIAWHLGPYVDTVKMSRAKNLVEVTIPHALEGALVLPFSNLKSYTQKLDDTRIPPVSPLVQVVTHGKNLESLDISCKQDLLWDYSGQSFSLERLTHLSLKVDTFSSSSSSSSFLKSLSFPKLQELCVSGFGDQTSFVKSLVKHSLPLGPASPLLRLRLRGRQTVVKPGSLPRLLEKTPNVEELEIDLPPIDDLRAIIKGSLTQGEEMIASTPSLVPDLRRLILRFSEPDGADRLMLSEWRRTALLDIAHILTQREIGPTGPSGDNRNKKLAQSCLRLVTSDEYTAKCLLLDLNFESYNSSEPSDLGSAEENIVLRDRCFSWRSRLLEALPELADKTTQPLIRKKFDSGEAADFDNLLQELETLEFHPGQSVANLYVTDLHNYIRRLSVKPEDCIPEDRKYTFRSRAERIFKDWNQIISTDLSSRQVNWVIQDPCTIVYVDNKKYGKVPSSQDLQTKSSTLESSGEPISPVPDLLKCNSSPSDEERSKIRGVLTIARERATKLQESLRCNPKLPEAARLRILRALERTETFICTHQSILSAVRLLPNEILAMIFIACLPDVENTHWKRHKWADIGSFSLSQVCRRWRYAAISTPLLWTVLGNIIVNKETEGDANGSSYLKVLEELLRRSRGHDLYVFISSPTVRYFSKCRVHPVVKILLEHEHRWAALGLHGSSFLVESIIDSSLRRVSPFVKLRKFFLNITWLAGPNIDTVDMSKAKSLTEVAVAHGMPERVVLLPLSTLQSYILKFDARLDITAESPLIHVLTQENRLEYLEISFNHDLRWVSHPGMHFSTFENLSVLSFRTDIPVTSTATTSTFFRSLSFPNLQELRVSGFRWQFLLVHSIIEHCLPHGPACPLLRLCMRQTLIEPGDLLKILEATPNLEELDIRWAPLEGLYDKIARSRHCKENSPETPALVPNLRGITLDFPTQAGNRVSVLSDGQRTALSNFARVMTDTRNVKGGARTEHRDGRAILPYFRLVTSEAHAAKSLLLGLNLRSYDSSELSPGDENNSVLRDKCFSWRSRLLAIFPELANEAAQPVKREYFDSNEAADFNDLLHELEIQELHPGQSVANLYVTDLHNYLRRLDATPDDYIPEGRKYYAFRSRAKRVLQYWDKIISIDMSTRQVNWALQDPCTIVKRRQRRKTRKQIRVPYFTVRKNRNRLQRPKKLHARNDNIIHITDCALTMWAQSSAITNNVALPCHTWLSSDGNSQPKNCNQPAPRPGSGNETGDDTDEDVEVNDGWTAGGGSLSS